MKTKISENDLMKLNEGVDKNSFFYIKPGDITIVKDWKPFPKDAPFFVEKREQAIACLKKSGR